MPRKSIMLLIGLSGCVPWHPFRYVEQAEKEALQRQAKAQAQASAAVTPSPEPAPQLDEPTIVTIGGSVYLADGTPVEGATLREWGMDELRTCTYRRCTLPFVGCLTGPAVWVPTIAPCGAFDRNTDREVDLLDVWVYMATNEWTRPLPTDVGPQ